MKRIEFEMNSWLMKFTINLGTIGVCLFACIFADLASKRNVIIIRAYFCFCLVTEKVWESKCNLFVLS